MEGIQASVDVLQALFLEDASLEDAAAAAAGVDVLQRGYELRLDRLAAVARLEAQLAALKARDVAECIDIQHAMTPPEAPVHERTYAEMSAVEEIAAVLTISSAAAGALVTQSRQLCSLPLAPALDALSVGTISWQHAKIIADETDSLGPAGTANLVAHFLDPDAPNPARGTAAGKLVPSRFRTKVRNWRERHHPESLEKRHTKSVADRRVEHSPDRD
ncbi:13E12 repeat family protein, partial [Pseudarthrobacter sp. R1]|nr:13E12 repeat family protein [Pseudarthrobacter sp. R1]